MKHLYLKTYLTGVLVSTIFLPVLAYAATTYSQDVFGLFEYIKDIFNDIVLWLFTTGAVIAFMAYIALQIFRRVKGGADSTKDANKNILFGLIALTLMFTFYAVAGLIAVTFGFSLGIPQFFKSQTGLSPGSGYVNNSYTIIGR
jgi:succinate dehydrogenase/fumarate reductase cytochrome b subunit